MRKILIGFLALASLALLDSSPAKAVTITDYPAGAAANGISGSRHNLGSMGSVIHSAQSISVPFVGTINLPSTTEICVFCHTPHHTNQSVAPAPLWNRVNAVSNYTAYGTTLGGSVINTVGSVSQACLSCHDGVTTFDTLVNAPGAGGINPAGSDQNYWFAMPNGAMGIGVTSNPLDHFGDAICTQCHGGSRNFAARLNIGTTVADDHPMSVTYMEDRASLRPKTVVINSIDLTTGLAVDATTALNGNLAQNRWAVKGYISSTATINDLLKNGKVECSSCHDPHFKNMSWDEAEPTWIANVTTGWCSGERCADGNFLRRVGGNTGSGVCRTCHNK